MAELPYDPLNFVLWLVWYYPGMIVIACVLCHVAVKASDDVAAAIPLSGTDKPDIATHSEIRIELGNLENYSKAGSGVGQTKDSGEKFESRLPDVGKHLSSGQNSTAGQGNHRRSRSKTPSVALLKIAIFWQGVQIWLLERMARMAARERIRSGLPILDSVFMLALCSTLVLLSTAALQERWNGASSGETVTGADRGKDTKKSRHSSRLLLAAVLLVLLPWYELLTAQYSP